MSLQGWEERLRLSVPQMDEEHKALIEAAADFRVAMDAGIPRSKLDCLLAGFLERAGRHFTSEEELMRSSGYPARQAHHNEHERLLDQIRILQTEFAAGKINACDAISLFMDVWTRQHILGPDRHLADFLKQSTPSGAATGQLRAEAGVQEHR